MHSSHPQCAGEGCLCQIYCTQCTACQRTFCPEHLPITQGHKCTPTATTIMPSMTAEGSRSIYRRTRSRELMGDHPISPLSAALATSPGSTQPGDLELSSPDLLKRPSSDLLRRGSSMGGFSRGPSALGGLGLSMRNPSMDHISSNGSSVPGGFVNRGLSLFGNSNNSTSNGDSIPEYLRQHSGSKSGGSDDGAPHHSLVGSLPHHPPNTHMIQMPQQKYTRSKSRELAALGLLTSPNSDAFPPTPNPYSISTQLASPDLSTSGHSLPFHTGAATGYLTNLSGRPMRQQQHQLSSDPALSPPTGHLLPPPHQSAAVATQALANVRNQFARAGSTDSESEVNLNQMITTKAPMTRGAPVASALSGNKRKASQTQQLARQAKQEEDTEDDEDEDDQQAPPPQPTSRRGASSSANATMAAVVATAGARRPPEHPVLKQEVSQPVGKKARKSAAAGSAATTAAAQLPIVQPRIQTAVSYSSANNARPAIATSFAAEQSRIEQTLSYLRSWSGSSNSSATPSSLSATSSASDISLLLGDSSNNGKFEDIFIAYRQESERWLEEYGSDPAYETKVTNISQALVILSLTSNDRHLADSTAAAHQSLHSNWSHQAGSRSHSPSVSSFKPNSINGPIYLPASSTLTFVSHPLLSTLSQLIRTLIEALHMNELEMVVWSLYLDRIEPDWFLHVQQKGKEVDRTLRFLHYTGYMVKSSFNSASSSSIFLPYLTAIYSDFSQAFSQWLHERSGLQLNIPPVLLNHRFNLIQNFKGEDGR